VISDQSHKLQLRDLFPKPQEFTGWYKPMYHIAQLVLQSVQLEHQRNTLPLMYGTMILMTDAIYVAPVIYTVCNSYTTVAMIYRR